MSELTIDSLRNHAAQIVAELDRLKSEDIPECVMLRTAKELDYVCRRLEDLRYGIYGY